MRQRRVTHEITSHKSSTAYPRHEFFADLVTETAMAWIEPDNAGMSFEYPAVSDDVTLKRQEDCLYFEVEDIYSELEPLAGAFFHTEGDLGDIEPTICLRSKQLHGVHNAEHVGMECSCRIGAATVVNVDTEPARDVTSDELSNLKGKGKVHIDVIDGGVPSDEILEEEIQKILSSPSSCNSGISLFKHYVYSQLDGKFSLNLRDSAKEIKSHVKFLIEQEIARRADIELPTIKPISGTPGPGN